MSTNEAIKVVQPDVIAEFRRILSPCDNKWAKYLQDPEYKFTFLEVWGAYHRAPQDVKDEVRPILEKEIAWWDSVDTSDPLAASLYNFSRDRVLDDSSKMDEHYLQCLIYWNEFKHEEASAIINPEAFEHDKSNITEEQKKYFESIFNKLEEGLAAEVVSVDIGAGMKITDSEEYLAKSVIKLLKGMNMAGSAVLADRINKMINGKHFKIMSDKFIPDPEMISKAFKGTAMEPYVWIIEGFLTAAKKAADRMDKGLENVSDIIEDTINELIARAESSNFDDLVEIIKRVKSKVDFGNLDQGFKVVAVTDPLPDLDPEPKPATETKPVPKKKEKKKKDVVEVNKPDTAAAMKRIPDEDPLATARSILASPPKVAPGFITQAPLNVQPEVKEEEPEILTIDDIPYALKEVVRKNDWILKIMNLAISNGVYIQLDPILNNIGDVVAMKFIANNRKGTFIPTKSFSVDFGMVINRALAVWPNIIAGQHGEIMTVPFETCEIAYKVDVYTKNGYQINRPFFNKLFAVGFSGLSSDDRSNNSRYSKQLINANRRLVMITRPNKSNDKRFNDYFNNASFKCAHELDKLAEAGEIPKDSRFKISLYDPDNGSVELTTEGVPQYWLTEPNQPRIVYHGFPAHKDGKFIKDEQGREYFYLVKVEG